MRTPPRRATHEWLQDLPACSTAQCRRKLQAGGEPRFMIAEDSTFRRPVWWLLVAERDGSLFRVVSGRNPFCRRVASLKVAYGIAMAAGLENFTIAIDRRSGQ